MNPTGMTSRARIAFALLWLGLLALAGSWISRHIELSGDLRKFMPARRSKRRDTMSKAAPAAGEGDAPMFAITEAWQ